MLNIITKGDQYYIPVIITLNSAAVTPENASDVRVKIGNYLQSYSDESLSYDTENRVWLFEMSEDMSRSFSRSEKFQVGVKFSNGSEFIYSRASEIPIGENIIGEMWGESND